MFDRLERAIRQVDEAVAELDASAHDAAEVVRVLARHEHRIAAVKTQWAGRAVEQRAHRRNGHATAEGWLAEVCGTSAAAARATLQTAEQLDSQPLLRQAFADGRLSPAQAREVARGAEADPGAAASLLESAARHDLRTLRRDAQRAVAAADIDSAARERRIHRQRTWRQWVDDDGTWCGMLRTTTQIGAEIQAGLDARTEAIFRRARSDGRREPREAYAADAASEALIGAANDVAAEGPHRRDLVIHIDYAALLRGRTVSGEMCEIEGVGPVPVEVAADFDADPFIKTVIRNGTDIRTVQHFGRHIPAVLRTAIDARSHLVDNRCQRCGRSFTRLEQDHIDPRAAGAPTSWENLQGLCHRCHPEKTLDDRRNGLTHAGRPPPPGGNDPP